MGLLEVRSNKYWQTIQVSLVALVVILLGFSSLANALAFSAYGAGTAGNPYQIGSCAQLQQVNYALSASYELIRNVNCTGTSLSPLDNGSSFSGTFNGQNHTIENLSITGGGLFGDAEGATIENLTLSGGSVTCSGECGGIAGQANNSTFTNVHSNLTLSGNSYLGGIVGLATDPITINQSSYSGTITSSSAYGGGLVGAVEGANSVINNSYFSGTFHSNGASYDGGLVGAIFSSGSTISNSYSGGHFGTNTSSFDNGGLVGGLFNGSVTNSFEASTFTSITGTNTSPGFGTNGGAATNTYFDTYLFHAISSAANCSLNNDPACTAVNVNNAAPSYFKGNSTNAPLNGWDFSSIWQTNANAYPTLVDQASFTDPTAPNSGDADGDGILDSYEPTVASTESSNDLWTTVSIPSASACSVQGAQSLASGQVPADSGYNLALNNLVNFDIYCPTAGATVPVTLILNQQYDTSGWVLRFYNTTTHAYSTIPGVTYGTTTVGGVAKTTVSYSITDGGSYDSDGSANGVIVDPVGLSMSAGTPSAPDTGFGVYRSGSGTPLVVAGLVSTGLAGLGWLIRRRLAEN